jgi:hypothetical protein
MDMPCGLLVLTHKQPRAEFGPLSNLRAAGQGNRKLSHMKYTVEAETVHGCDCGDCRAGKHIYSLFQWTDGGWKWAAISLLSYSSVEECKAKHPWMIAFGPEDTWEDGSPLVDPDPVQTLHSKEGQLGPVRMVALDTRALAKSADLLERHWRPGRE